MKKLLILLLGLLLCGCSSRPAGKLLTDGSFEYQQYEHVSFGTQPDLTYLKEIAADTIVIDTRYDVHGFKDEAAYYLDSSKTVGRSVNELLRWEEESGLLPEEKIVKNYYRIPVKENGQPDAAAVDQLVAILKARQATQPLFIHGRLLDSGVKALAAMVECFYDDQTELQGFDERFRSYVQEFKASGFDRSYNIYLLISQ